MRICKRVSDVSPIIRELRNAWLDDVHVHAPAAPGSVFGIMLLMYSIYYLLEVESKEPDIDEADA